MLKNLPNALTPRYLALLSCIRPLFPCICHLCQTHSHQALCDDCRALLQTNTGDCCSSCDLPLYSGATLCADCQKSPPSFTTTICAFRYQFPSDYLIQQYKDHYALHWGKLLGETLIDRIHTHYPYDHWPNLIIPVPIHWSKRLKRGYNQSALLAKYLAHRLKIPYSTPLQKHQRTHAQLTLDKRQRLQNLRHSFRCNHTLANKHIALVDDVITTSATAETLSKVLITAGAKRVDIWALARTAKPDF